MLKGLGNRATKARSVIVLAKRSQASSSVKNTVGNLPGKVNDEMISVKEEKFPPRSRPIEDTEHRKELHDTMRTT